MSESGLLFRIICTFVQGMALFTEGICLEKLLTGRDDRGGRKMRILNWFAWNFIFVFIVYCIRHCCQLPTFWCCFIFIKIGCGSGLLMEQCCFSKIF